MGYTGENGELYREERLYHCSSRTEACCRRCHYASSQSFLAPFKSKMKGLKKLGMRIGLGSSSHSSSCDSFYSPPLRFHSVHGDNIFFEKDRTVARRKDSFCKGLTFSDRPIKVEEKILVKLVEFSDNWSGVIRFGFTSHNPATLKGRLPKYACPDLTSEKGHWAKAVNESHYSIKNIVLYFYVSKSGSVYYGVNGKPKELFFTGVDTSGPLWAVIDVYGNSTAVELINEQLNNTLSADQEAGFGLDANIDQRNSRLEERKVEADLKKLSLQNSTQEMGRLDEIIRGTGRYVEQCSNTLQNLIRSPETKVTRNLNLKPLVFHERRGQNIRLSKDRYVATRLDTDYCNGYVFSSMPIGPNEFVVVQILETGNTYLGSLTFGVTTKNPINIDPKKLPEDSDDLLCDDHSFIVCKNVANNPTAGDILIFSLNEEGEIKMKKNEEPQSSVFFVEKGERYWWFFDLYGSTTKIRAYCGVAERPLPGMCDARIQPICESSDQGSNEYRNEQVPTHTIPHTVVLVLNYCVNGSRSSFEPISIHTSNINGPIITATTSTHSLPSVSSDEQRDLYESSYDNGKNREQQYQEGMKAKNPSATDCIVCYENQVDCVLYQCGHMCLCYSCARKLWHGKEDGSCPCCRAEIRDVVRIYKS